MQYFKNDSNLINKRVSDLRQYLSCKIENKGYLASSPLLDYLSCGSLQFQLNVGQISPLNSDPLPLLRLARSHRSHIHTFHWNLGSN